MAEFLYVAIPAVTSLIGRGFVNSAIKETAISTYNLLYKFVEHPEINITLQTLDIKATMKSVKTIMNNIQLKHVSEPIYESLQLLHQIICHISDDLTKLKKTAKDYDKKWFKSWRTADYKYYLQSLDMNTKVLEKRLDNFYKLLEINDKFPSIMCKYTETYSIENKQNEDMTNTLIMTKPLDNDWEAIVPLF
jgi:hypothetical protein